MPSRFQTLSTDFDLIRRTSSFPEIRSYFAFNEMHNRLEDLGDLEERKERQGKLKQMKGIKYLKLIYN